MCKLESKQTEWELENICNTKMLARKDFNEKTQSFICVMSSISNHCDQSNDVSNSNNNDVECYSIETFKKRKMESSTPVTWRKERKIMEELESPIMLEGEIETQESTNDSCGEVTMDENPTGISDDLQSKHLSPLKSETSSVENSKLFTTARNW